MRAGDAGTPKGPSSGSEAGRGPGRPPGSGADLVLHLARGVELVAELLVEEGLAPAFQGLGQGVLHVAGGLVRLPVVHAADLLQERLHDAVLLQRALADGAARGGEDDAL